MKPPRTLLSCLCGFAVLFAAGSSVLAQSITITKLWEIPAGGRPYLPSAGNTERGIAYNPVNGHVYIPSRVGGNKVFILDGETGVEVLNPDNGDLPQLKTTGISGGTFAINLMGVSDDGAIFAANLSTAASPQFKLYRWDSEAADPVVVYSGNPLDGTGYRWGDSLDVAGSGAETRVVISSGGTGAAGTKAVAVFTHIDETLTLMAPTAFLPSGVNNEDLRLGITFGAGNTLFGKTSGRAAARYIGYDPSVPSATTLGSPSLESGISVLKYEPANKILFGLNANNNVHKIVAYDATTPDSVSVLASINFPAGGTANGNLTGGIAATGSRVYALDTHNGVIACRIVVDNSPTAPSITANPVGLTILEGGSGSLSAAASGTKPLTYQWLRDGEVVPDATNTTLRLQGTILAQAGSYRLRVDNAGGSAQSEPAVVAVTPSVRSAALVPLWRLLPGDRPYITSDNTQRGLAYNPATRHLVLASRTPTNAVYVLSAADGSEIRTLSVDASVIALGTFTLSMIGVADDGVIYGANLTTDGASAGQPFRVYRWSSEEAGVVPELIFSGDPNNGAGSQRWGDSFDVRGSGLDTQIVIGSRNGPVAAILTTADGVSFTSTPIVTSAPNGSFGLGVAFGPEGTFFGKQAGSPLVQVAFDLAAGTGEVVASIPVSDVASSVGAIAYDPLQQYLAALSTENSDNLRLYGIATESGSVTWLDTEFFGTDADNLNFTGAADFGDGRLFALATNNGLLASQVAPRLNLVREGGDLVLTWAGPYTLESSSSLGSAAGGWTPVVGAVSGHRVTPQSGARFFRLAQSIAL